MGKKLIKIDCNCREKELFDFESNELMSEVLRRGLLGYSNVNIITIDLFTRFSKVITVAELQELETIILNLETKYKLL